VVWFALGALTTFISTIIIGIIIFNLNSYGKTTFKCIKEVFKTYPQEDKIILVSDGHVFLMNAQSLAIDHARRNGLEYSKLFTATKYHLKR
jgi:hypothetical protein